ncbi:MAG: hypothetical protein KKH52_03410 [Nanoarchaeota archaeon]|nr:hypothetical protein [Nanoarchaeota archaeon]MBU1623008.1 hypothetical protein [Nanoarchaeota archaeon]MBU1974416.1 hypothetical protein [Nanoarchaeota archaeon]
MFQNFNFNKKEGFFGLICLSFTITLFCFSIAYFIEAASWLGEDGGIAANWFTGGGIMLGIGIILMVIFAILIKKAKQPKTTKKLDFNKPKSILGLISIPAGIIFLVNGAIYRAEGTRWFWAGVNTATEWYLAESSRWFTSSMIMFLIGIGLVCGGAFLLVMQYREGRSV